MKSSSLRIAHLSDPHFALLTFHPQQFLSKRWLGNLNHFLFRQFTYETTHLLQIPSFLKDLKVDYVCITGDFTTTSQTNEFAIAQQFVNLFNEPVLALPGNHDCYTKEAEKSAIYHSYFAEDDFKETRLAKKQLSNNWWWVGLDCSKANPCFYANGEFYPFMKKKLEEWLASIPKDHHIIVGNHFPLYNTFSKKHDLIGRHDLQDLFKRHPQIKIYLHGHDHRPYIIDKQKEDLPLVINAGSCAQKRKGNFYILDLVENECQIRRCWFSQSRDKGWVMDLPESYRLY